MGQVENLRKLVLSGKKENIELVKQLVLSPRLHKARGVLLHCNIRIEPAKPVDGGGIWAHIASMEGECCKNQPRRRCVKCSELMCNQHLTDEGRCHVCIGAEDYHRNYISNTITWDDFERMAQAFINAGRNHSK